MNSNDYDEVFQTGQLAQYHTQLRADIMAQRRIGTSLQSIYAGV